MARSISAKAISGFVRAVRYLAGTRGRFNRARLLVQLSGRNSRNASMTGTSPRASVSDTSVWQLAVLPSAEARHRLNALAIARTDQPRHVERTHLSPRLVTQPIQKRFEKAAKLVFPIRRSANHGRPLQKPTTHESQKN